jgi:hypothetical protein
MTEIETVWDDIKRYHSGEPRTVHMPRMYVPADRFRLFEAEFKRRGYPVFRDKKLTRNGTKNLLFMCVWVCSQRG